MERTIVRQVPSAGRQVAYVRGKRATDLGLCLVALPLVVPLMALIGLLVRLDSPGPAILRQVRVGKKGRRFRMYKFRTMHNDLDDSTHRTFMQQFVKGELDEDDLQEVLYKPIAKCQVTRIGRLLRAASLDELPQLFNVLRGEMSLVGPRPNVPWEVEAYRDWHGARLAVLPGITGLAQVNGRSCITFDRIAQLDIEYIRNQSLRLDLQILWATVRAVVAREGVG